MAEIVVCGYPRSGNVWLARLLGDALDWPVVGIQGGRGSLAAEGEDRPGPGRVRQAHLWPGKAGPMRVEAPLLVQVTQIRVAEGERKGQPARFVHIVRDPRDVAVSAAHYWDWTLDRVLDVMIEGPGPLGLPPWLEFVEAWKGRAIWCRYEDLHKDTEYRLALTLRLLELEARKPLAGVVERQSFGAKRREMERHGDKYAFGKEAQLRHLRKGISGEWVEVFSPEQADRAWKAWGPMLLDLGHEP